MGSYIDGPPAHGNPPQNQMYPGYQSQGNHPASMGVGVSPQAIGVAQQAQYLQPGQAANQRVPISHTTRASPITVRSNLCLEKKKNKRKNIVKVDQKECVVKLSSFSLQIS